MPTAAEAAGEADGADREPRVRWMISKRDFRARAHSNPLNDGLFEPPLTPSELQIGKLFDVASPKVHWCDIGCGYGGLLATLSTAFPDKLMLGLEIRDRVAQFCRQRVLEMRKQVPGSYGNVAQPREAFLLLPGPALQAQEEPAAHHFHAVAGRVRVRAAGAHGGGVRGDGRARAVRVDGARRGRRVPLRARHDGRGATRGKKRQKQAGRVVSAAAQHVTLKRSVFLVLRVALRCGDHCAAQCRIQHARMQLSCSWRLERQASALGTALSITTRDGQRAAQGVQRGAGAQKAEHSVPQGAERGRQQLVVQVRQRRRTGQRRDKGDTARQEAARAAARAAHSDMDALQRQRGRGAGFQRGAAGRQRGAGARAAGGAQPAAGGAL
ncbi:tRNA (guanine-N-7) methyltransferase Trmb type [Gracilaria domingensis]|nr:tRNA (guanine-N-7) methyltransferase Trmb type [Gracilaria domingensis]